jgi:prolipoprotein diacylglyceryl transferase
MFQLFGLTFHLYGFLIGSAVTLAVLMGEKVISKETVRSQQYWSVVLVMLVGGLCGARLYHVWTDWPLYQYNPVRIPQIWNGGLSIIGAVVGGLLSLCVYFFVKTKSWSLTKEQFLFWGDVAALSVPFGQAIGRLGNWVNQELYGSPSSLPWAISIDPQHRLVGYEHISRYHPLFAYEALGMVGFGLLLWWIFHKKLWKLGEGFFLVSYLSWYGLFRGMLEFLRLEKATVYGTHIGLNQLLLFLVGGSCVVLLGVLCKKKCCSVRAS